MTNAITGQNHFSPAILVISWYPPYSPSLTVEYFFVFSKTKGCFSEFFHRKFDRSWVWNHRYDQSAEVRYSHYSVSSTNQAAFFIGGHDGSSPLSVIAKYENDNWSLHGNLKRRRSGHGSITYGTKQLWLVVTQIMARKFWKQNFINILITN